MIFGFFMLVIGYALFYWGIHHFGNNASWRRYSFWTLIGACALSPGGCGNKGQSLLSATGNPINPDPVQFAFGGAPPGQGGTQGQNPQNNTTPSPLAPGSNNWQQAILQGLGAPTSSNNVAKLNAWNKCEGNLSGQSGLGANNPFNTTCDCCGGNPIATNSAGVRNYPSLSAGVQATLNTLQGGQYGGIISNLTSDGSTAAFAAAVGASPWGTSGSCIAGVLG